MAFIIRQLWHLEGLEVALLIDGEVYPRQTVSNGELEIDFDGVDEESEIVVGLPYDSILETLPPAWEGQEALAQAEEKNVSKVFARVHNTSNIMAGPDVDNLRTFPPRSNEDYNEPTAFKSQYIEIPIDPEWDIEGKIVIKNSDPLPVTVTGLVIEVEA